MAGDKITVTFVDALASKSYQAALAPACTAQYATNKLMSQDTGPFLPPQGARPYVLIHDRANKEIAPNMTMREAGVIDNDVIVVEQKTQGAS